MAWKSLTGSSCALFLGARVAQPATPQSRRGSDPQTLCYHPYVLQADASNEIATTVMQNIKHRGDANGYRLLRGALDRCTPEDDNCTQQVKSEVKTEASPDDDTVEVKREVQSEL